MNYTERLEEVEIFRRFPDFIPFIGEKYADVPAKVLLIWESYYDTTGATTKYDKNIEGWYKSDKQEVIDSCFCKMFKGEGRENYDNHWNFASKMHAKGIDRKSATFGNVEKLLPFQYCAGYNYYLRPATGAKSIKDTVRDNEIANNTLQEIIKILQPDFVLFFSKKACNSFQQKCENVEFKAFVHPACAWWNRKYGKTKQTGKERFEKFCERNKLSLNHLEH